MWIKVRNIIVNLDGGASLKRDGSSIRLETEETVRKTGRAVRIADYVNPERAEEVMQEFWKAVRLGELGYEFPEV